MNEVVATDKINPYKTIVINSFSSGFAISAMGMIKSGSLERISPNA